MATRTAGSDPRTTPQARRIEVHGLVQSVGFRPFVWREAVRLGLTGRVLNRSGVVEIVAEGPASALEEFCEVLRRDAPPLARVDDVSFATIAPTGSTSFEVGDSIVEAGGGRDVSPDVATCDACLRELFDPTDRRYRYAFTNCTDCGPRFTIIDELPYDRSRTSMRGFELCDDCRREYEDPADRRFHAEPIACPACGPSLALVRADGSPVEGDPIETAAALLTGGAIVALKGLGGFHLACDATDADAVATLRERKRRPHKPFAVMVADLDQARAFFDLSAEDEVALTSPQAPIVLVADRGSLAEGVAPGFRRQGAMLPSTPLHHLLLRAVERPLVMTSGNLSDEPICIDGDEARERLRDVADAFLVHDRPIVSRYDDSVVRTWRGGPVTIRRARGLAPAPFDLGRPVVPTLGTGAELHGAFCLATGSRAYLSQHVGDLDSDAAIAAYRDALERYRRVFGIEPELVAHDLHPDMLTTRLAAELEIPAVAVQHHHAHVASVIAEHRLDGPVIGVAFDGFGLGTDGAAWGGEFLVVDGEDARRLGHLRTVPLPGGDAAVRWPWRIAASHLDDADALQAAGSFLEARGAEADVVLAQIRSETTPRTSSMGRLFDAVAALLGLVDETTFEGQPAILLEQVAEGGATHEYPFDVAAGNGGVVLDARPTIAAVVRDIARGRRPGEVAGRFHRTVAAATLEVCRAIRGITGIGRVCLSGGVFQNALLTSDLVARLEAVDLEVHVPRRAPAGDGGLALGQVLVASATAEA